MELDARRIRVRRSITQVGGKLVEGNPKSVAGRRSIPIPERLVPLFKARLDGRRGARRRSRPREVTAQPGELEARRRMEKAIEQVGRQKLRVHDLRHTYASLSRRAGADLRLLQKVMGHASITVTAHTYATDANSTTSPPRSTRSTICSETARGFGPILAPSR